jgi:hypothetical protein
LATKSRRTDKTSTVALGSLSARFALAATSSATGAVRDCQELTALSILYRCRSM